MSRAEAEKLYALVPDEKFPIPAVDVGKINPKYYRRTVRYDSNEAPGTIIVDPGNYYVYRIEGEGNATRYGANVGRSYGDVIHISSSIELRDRTTAPPAETMPSQRRGPRRRAAVKSLRDCFAALRRFA